IAALLIAAILVMAAALLVVFRSRPRLLPLAIALAATGITFGLLGVLGAGLTLASIAVLPILIGLAVDSGIQFQARAQEARTAAARERGMPLPAAQAVGQAAASAAPAIATAALATGTGFLVLLLSPVPMVQGFGLLLVVGIAVAFVCARTAGSAVLVLSERDLGVIGASIRGAADLLAGLRLRVPRRRMAPRPRPGGDGVAARVATAALGRPGRVLAVAAALAVVGWIADTQIGVQSDVTKLVPASMPALRNLNTLEKVTGVSGEIDVTVHARDVATPQVVGWMVRYENGLLSRYGSVEKTGCAK